MCCLFMPTIVIDEHEHFGTIVRMDAYIPQTMLGTMI